MLWGLGNPFQKWKLNSKPNVWLSVTTSSLAESPDPFQRPLRKCLLRAFLRAAACPPLFQDREGISAKEKASKPSTYYFKAVTCTWSCSTWELSKWFLGNSVVLWRGLPKSDEHLFKSVYVIHSARRSDFKRHFLVVQVPQEHTLSPGSSSASRHDDTKTKQW